MVYGVPSRSPPAQVVQSNLPVASGSGWLTSVWHWVEAASPGARLHLATSKLHSHTACLPVSAPIQLVALWPPAIGGRCCRAAGSDSGGGGCTTMLVLRAVCAGDTVLYDYVLRRSNGWDGRTGGRERMEGRSAGYSRVDASSRRPVP